MVIQFTKSDIQRVAKDEGMGVFDVISTLQGFASETGDNETLEALCDVKNIFIDEIWGDDQC